MRPRKTITRIHNLLKNTMHTKQYEHTVHDTPLSHKLPVNHTSWLGLHRQVVFDKPSYTLPLQHPIQHKVRKSRKFTTKIHSLIYRNRILQFSCTTVKHEEQNPAAPSCVCKYFSLHLQMSNPTITTMHIPQNPPCWFICHKYVSIMRVMQWKKIYIHSIRLLNYTHRWIVHCMLTGKCHRFNWSFNWAS